MRDRDKKCRYAHGYALNALLLNISKRENGERNIFWVENTLKNSFFLCVAARCWGKGARRERKAHTRAYFNSDDRIFFQSEANFNSNYSTSFHRHTLTRAHSLFRTEAHDNFRRMCIYFLWFFSLRFFLVLFLFFSVNSSLSYFASGLGIVLLFFCFLILFIQDDPCLLCALTSKN